MFASSGKESALSFLDFRKHHYHLAGLNEEACCPELYGSNPITTRTPVIVRKDHYTEIIGVRKALRPLLNLLTPTLYKN